MTSYTGRRPTNMSEYIANLNSTAPLRDNTEELTDLNVFANAEFFDFDMAAQVDFDQQEAGRRNDSIASWNGQPGTDFLNGDFQFSDISAIPNILSNPNATNLSPISTSTNFSAVPQQNLGLPQQSPVTPSSVNAKRKASDLLDPSLSLEERTRFAAEEDKRRRNTAASARFRVKKKQREQALEKTAREMTEKAQGLEKRVQELEMENRWLKGLITEKDGGESIQDRYARFIAEGGEEGAKNS